MERLRVSLGFCFPRITCAPSHATTRTLVYAVECPIRMRTGMGPKIVPSPILMRTESTKICRRSENFWVHKWPVGSDVRSYLRTFCRCWKRTCQLQKKITTKISPSGGHAIYCSRYTYLSPFNCQLLSRLHAALRTFAQLQNPDGHTFSLSQSIHTQFPVFDLPTKLMSQISGNNCDTSQQVATLPELPTDQNQF